MLTKLELNALRLYIKGIIDAQELREIMRGTADKFTGQR